VDVHVLWINPHAHYLAREMKGFAKCPTARKAALPDQAMGFQLAG
jgi:hypothetical protein